jgi:hypothetical protein
VCNRPVPCIPSVCHWRILAHHNAPKYDGDGGQNPDDPPSLYPMSVNDHAALMYYSFVLASYAGAEDLGSRTCLEID